MLCLLFANKRVRLAGDAP